MNRKILLAATILAGVPFAAHAGDDHYNSTTYEHHNSSTQTYADRNWAGVEGPYMTVLGGYNNPEGDNGLDPDGGWIGGVAFGGKTEWARAELEASYRNSDLDNVGGGDVDSTAIMANAYWDFENNTGITPYVGAGIGTAYVDFDSVGGDDSWEFAYQGMAGANINVAPQWAVGAEYRYFATTEVGDTDYDNHAVIGTVRYTFN
ncbi:MAG TPA: outer membrane beta-barrel protein [Alphaproteobacteria bacterium]